MVPEGADLLGAEAVDVAPPGQHRVLGDARHAVLRIRHVDAVPVDGDAVLDVAVPQCHLDEIALPHTQLGPGHGVAEGERVHRAARGDSRIRACWAVSVKRSSGEPAGPWSSADVDPARVGGVLRAAAELVRAEVHDVVGLRQAALVPHPAEPAEGADRNGRAEHDAAIFGKNRICVTVARPARSIDSMEGSDLHVAVVGSGPAGF